jgi:Zn-dependent peptidase ImmA (M78 family)/transcriptional regulator with XRE-family HTH domain
MTKKGGFVPSDSRAGSPDNSCGSNPGLLPLQVPDTLTRAAAAAFDPRRLALARQRNGWTKRRLAELADLSPAAITQYELGQARPSAASLSTLAAHLGLPVGYFAAGRPVIPLAVAESHFRSLRSTRQHERQQALATMSHFAELVVVLSRAVRLPDVSLPFPSSSGSQPPVPLSRDTASDDDAVRTAPGSEGGGTTPEATARALRASWGLPRGPFPHLLRQIEMHGIAVAVARYGSSEHIDAFSGWPARLGRPVMCLSADRGNILRRRFSAAHELGHLILHPRPAPGDARHEHDANRFAAELLMPAADIRRLLPRRLDLAQLIELQQQWGVSVQALLRRCQELGTLSQSTYKRGMTAVTDLGWRKQEPALDYQGEWPAMLSAAIDLVRSRGVDESVLAEGLCLPPAEIADLLGRAEEQRPALRLVASAPDAVRPQEHPRGFAPASPWPLVQITGYKWLGTVTCSL